MSVIMNPDHSLALGGFQLIDNGMAVTHTAGYTTHAYAEGTSFGKPQPITRAIISLLRSGSQQVTERWDNREVAIRVVIKAATIAGLNAGEVELNAVIGIPVELRWQPPAPGAPLTVFDVVNSSMELAFDDMDELNLTRVYAVTLAASPWPRSASKVITPAVATISPTVLDTGAATTNWTAAAPAGATLSVVSGAVTSTYSPSVSIGGGYYGTQLRRNFPSAVDTSVNKYIAVDWKTSLASVQGLIAVNGVPFADLTEVRREPAPVATFTRSWYRLADATVSLSQFTFSIIHPSNAAASATLSIDQVLLANVLPASGSVRQVTRTVDPNGSVAAEGDIKVEHATAGLGQTIVFSHPTQGGYSPPLRQWRVASSTVITDPNSVSGSQNPLDATMSFVIPASSIPTGDVHLWARVVRATAGSGTINGAAFSAASAGAYVGDSQPFSVQRTFPANQWQLMPLARLTLPTAKIGAAGFVQIDMIGTGLVIDEAWLFAMDKGTLTVLDCGSGTPVIGSVANRLKISAPSLDDPNGSIVVGTAADWSNAFTPAASTILCDQTGHRFDPNGSAILVVTAGPTTEASVSFEHYPRWHSNAAS